TQAGYLSAVKDLQAMRDYGIELADIRDLPRERLIVGHIAVVRFDCLVRAICLQTSNPVAAATGGDVAVAKDAERRLIPGLGRRLGVSRVSRSGAPSRWRTKVVMSRLAGTFTRFSSTDRMSLPTVAAVPGLHPRAPARW